MAPTLLAGDTYCSWRLHFRGCPFALGLVWRWQGGHVWIWALAAAALGVVAWPLSTLVSRRANEEARLALGDWAAPSRPWNAVEQDAWAAVL
jgi:hypothetical protein